MLFSVGLLALAALPSSFGAVIQARQDDPENPPRDPQPPPPGPIFGRAPELDKRFQPALDFDTDSCYNVPAIGPNGDLAIGMFPFEWPPQAGCRNEEMLDRGNVYSRQRCNNGYCVIFYAYYFQKDTATPIDGHRHDWEHIAVWVRQSDSFVTHVAVSQHKGYEIRENSQVTWTAAENGKPAIVYHKDSILTHCFRFGNGADAGGPGPENHRNQWITGPLLGYFGWDTVEQRDRMLTHNWEAGAIAIKNENFAENIRKARPAGLVFDENIDDEGTNNI
ncbi:necrosis- and ethylene-inducing protein-inducing protein [Verticillium alfalfae VaMs.102]|uniref:Necrosis-and ethylene-inducing protein-inducing protein n=1 Tax=Verticillium alfalfae (strain VaMs.102 / ATCC MYA-4576 / FGSC 10136) TaxID=526221 RepID=C9SWV1_VERA1|nr:necrosis- and ethylene-inducing protein-inducing protein [Verticillium alfalfae VaMs.102]EEY23492.1 necrosis- and ethylene-inducing protein-inducing protein [Verticillium alfalfae VaMs.102]